ncbi:MAG: glycosyltransferase [Cyanobacteria bacterium J06597_16]
MSPITISLIIPVYYGGDNFKACLASIKTSLRPPDDVIVVADGETDRSWQVAEDFGARVIRLSESGGPARARNIGAKIAQGNILFFIDADVTLHPETLSVVEQLFLQSPTTSAVIGSYDDAPGASNFLSQYKNLFHHYTHQVSSEAATTFWGACGAIDRSIFQAIGGFDEKYTDPCIEDIELGYRLQAAGYSIRLCKHLQVKHLKHWTVRSLLKAEIFYRAIPWTKLLLSQRQIQADLNLSASNQASVVCTYLFIISVAISSWLPQGIVVALVLSGLLLVINASVYRFFTRKRGVWFALRVVPWHWLYFLYGGLAFAYGTVQHYWESIFPSQRHLSYFNPFKRMK